MVAGCFRHCGRDHAHGEAAGWAYAYFWRLWIWNRKFQLLGSCVSDIGRWFLSRNLTNWRQSAPHPCFDRGVRGCIIPAAVLCLGIHHADGLIRQLARPTGPSVSLSGTVGATTLTVEQIASHTHATPAGKEQTSAVLGNDLNVIRLDGKTGATGGSQSHTHSLSGTKSGAASSLPPYYALSYIMRIA